MRRTPVLLWPLLAASFDTVEKQPRKTSYMQRVQPAMNTTTFPNRPQQYEPTPEDMEQLASQWRAGISDPAPESGTLYDWLRRYGKSIMHNSVAACIRKYRYLHSQQTPMDYDHAVRYTASCARNARNAANEFHAPTEWTEQP
jgi:hypothetical protein